MRRGRRWRWVVGMVGDGCREGGGEEDGGVNAGELNGTRPDGERRLAGGDGVRRGRGDRWCRMIGGRGRPRTCCSLRNKRCRSLRRRRLITMQAFTLPAPTLAQLSRRQRGRRGWVLKSEIHETELWRERREFKRTVLQKADPCRLTA